MNAPPGGPEPSYFVGFPFPYAGALGGLAPAPPRVRLFDPADLHLTLAFFGRSGVDLARAGFAAVDASAMEPVEVTLGGARLLGNPRHPTAIARVLGVGADVLGRYVGAHRDRALGAAGLGPEKRDPLPHLTIARIQRRATSADRVRAVAWLKTVAPSEARFAIDRVALYTWSDERLGGGSRGPSESPPPQFRIVEERRLGAR